jgi:uncharacterized protein (TIGR02466 family)
MIIDKCFTTPIGYDFVSDSEFKLITKEYEDILPFLESSGNTWGDNITTTYNKYHNIIKNFNMKNLEMIILSKVNQFTKNFNNDFLNDLKIKQSWLNYTLKYQSQDYHHHRTSIISGVLYLKTNKMDGNIRFHSPFYTNCTLTSSPLIEYQPEEGKIIFFPSWAPHSVNQNLTDDMRISLSFNLN